MKEVLDELTRWGAAGCAVTLRMGMTWDRGAVAVGWACSIAYEPRGSVSIGTLRSNPFGYHPTDPIEAARAALRQAADRWPEMVER